MAFRKVCKFCERKVERIDYKDADTLGRLITDRGKILPRRATGTCAPPPASAWNGDQEGAIPGAGLPYIQGYHS